MIFLVVAALTFIAGLNMFAYLSSQVSIAAVVRLYFSHTNQARYVSLSTNALTGAHSLCLFIVVVWFIYQLKRETKLVKWSNTTLSGWRKVVMGVLSDWRKVVADAPSRLMNVLLSPLDKSNHGRHYQRSICLWVEIAQEKNTDNRMHEGFSGWMAVCFSWTALFMTETGGAYGHLRTELLCIFDQPHVSPKQQLSLFSDGWSGAQSETRKQAWVKRRQPNTRWKNIVKYCKTFLAVQKESMRS